MRALRLACAVSALFGLALATGCYDFDADRAACVDAGRCLPDEPDDAGGGEPDDAGTEDGGQTDAGEADAGGPPTGVPVRPAGPYGSCDAGTFLLTEPVCRSGWCWENPLPTGETLRAVNGLSSQVWLAGGRGVVLEVAGCEIRALPPFVDGTFNDVQPRSIKSLYFAAGDAGVFRYADGTWTNTSPADTYGAHSAVALERDQTGDPFAGGSGGALAVFRPPLDNVFPGTPVPNGLTDLARGAQLWALGVNNELYEGAASFATTAAWTPRSHGAPGALRAIHAHGEQVWLVGDQGTVVHRPDAGLPFTAYSQDAFKLNGARVNLTRVRGDGARVWLMGEGGALWEWMGNSVFTQSALDPSGTAPLSRSTLWDAWMPSTGAAWVVGEGGTVLLQENGAWRDLRTLFESPSVDTLHAVAGAGDTVWAAGNGDRLLCLRDHRWTGCGAEDADTKRLAIRALTAVSPERVFVGGPGGVLAEVTLEKWTSAGFTAADGGEIPAGGPFAVHGMFSLGGEGAWAVGEHADGGGLILQRADGGWHEHPAGLGRPRLHAVHGRSADDVWIVGDDGMVLHLFPPGQVASFSDRAPGKALRAVYVDADGTAYLAGQGVILGIGQTGAAKAPSAVTPPAQGITFHGVAPVGDGGFVAVGEGGTTYGWSSSGGEATPVPRPTDNTLRGAWTDPVSGQVWVVGDHGSILRLHPSQP